MSEDLNPKWLEIILSGREAAKIWAEIFAALEKLARENSSPASLHAATVIPDRLLAEAAWELWQAYPDAADRTSESLKRWCVQEGGSGRAVLIVDALSLRELPYLLGGAELRGLKPAQVKITGAECPSTTDQFAESLGAPGRSGLEHDGKPGSFALFGGDCHTGVLRLPFEDCPVPPEPYIVFWHTWLDELIHVQKKAPDAVAKAACQAFQGSGFWDFLDRLRRGRSLVVTSDHGYAASHLFSSAVVAPAAAETLRTVFGASRHAQAAAWPETFLPPLALAHNRHQVVMGQWKWKIQGGFPQLCHGGLSLLEVAVPWLEFDPL